MRRPCTWDEAETILPGCSVEWDLMCNGRAVKTIDGIRHTLLDFDGSPVGEWEFVPPRPPAGEMTHVARIELEAEGSPRCLWVTTEDPPDAEVPMRRFYVRWEDGSWTEPYPWPIAWDDRTRFDREILTDVKAIIGSLPLSHDPSGDRNWETTADRSLRTYVGLGNDDRD